ncbi:flagellar hook-basal body complex protein [bacterium AH-315-F18]|nr:flagellar hook-basal body complex protein [bacterium AH-315-F18]
MGMLVHGQQQLLLRMSTVAPRKGTSIVSFAVRDIEGNTDTEQVLRSIDRALHITRQNIVNANTAGYKALRPRFQREGTSLALQTYLPQGALGSTGSIFDFAIEGSGYFQVLGYEGEMLYTRDGRFQLDAEGRLVTAFGYPVTPEIIFDQVDVNSISVGVSGFVEVSTVRDPMNSFGIGQLQLARFPNPEKLRHTHAGFFQETEESGGPDIGIPAHDCMGKVRQGFFEKSNVDVATEQFRIAKLKKWFRVLAQTSGCDALQH